MAAEEDISEDACALFTDILSSRRCLFCPRNLGNEGLSIELNNMSSFLRSFFDRAFDDMTICVLPSLGTWSAFDLLFVARSSSPLLDKLEEGLRRSWCSEDERCWISDCVIGLSLEIRSVYEATLISHLPVCGHYFLLC